MFWAMVHGHYISIEKREKQSHSCVEVTVVIPPHKEEREPLEQVASLIPLSLTQNCIDFFYLLYCKTMQATQSVDGSWTRLLTGSPPHLLLEQVGWGP